MKSKNISLNLPALAKSTASEIDFCEHLELANTDVRLTFANGTKVSVVDQFEIIRHRA